MNIALIIAGGNGQRMGQEIPKQFINVDNKPIIVYTLEAFQKHSEIDQIAVVCLEGWHEILLAYAKQFNISKLVKVILGGENGQSSIRNGVFGLKENCSDHDIILVHDAIRPMVSQEIITDCIKKCKEYGSAVSAISCAEAVLISDNKSSSNKVMPRDNIMRTQTPQAFQYKRLYNAHNEAISRGIISSVASCTLMVELGETVHFSLGSEKNIKLTTVEDIEIFKALLKSEKYEWLK